MCFQTYDIYCIPKKGQNKLTCAPAKAARLRPIKGCSGGGANKGMGGA